MRIAVLLSTYNGEAYLREQIESILHQNVDDQIDLIVRDDGSSDLTIMILREYVKLGKLQLIEGQNVGAAKSFIELLRLANGYDYYAFSDQDDVWYEDKLDRAITSLTGIEGPALYCSNTVMVDKDLNYLGRNAHRKTPTYNLISVLCLASCAQGCTTVINTALADIVQHNDIPTQFVMHDSLITSVCSIVGGTIIYDHNPTMLYRMHEQNVFGLVTAKQNLIEVMKKRLAEISTKNTISMSVQAQSLLSTYNDCISTKNKSICTLVASTDRSILARLLIVMNPNLKHDTLNMTITKKLSIIVGNN